MHPAYPLTLNLSERRPQKAGHQYGRKRKGRSSTKRVVHSQNQEE
jgi:hypothetical protein